MDLSENRTGPIDSMPKRRSRHTVTIALGCVILIGLASRRYPWTYPALLADYPGDAFWAMAAYLGIVLVRPAIPVRNASMIALAISFAVEFSQLYHDDWIDSIRATTFGRLVLGSGFDPLDLLAYVAGVVIVMIVDQRMRSDSRTPDERNVR